MGCHIVCNFCCELLVVAWRDELEVFSVGECGCGAYAVGHVSGSIRRWISTHWNDAGGILPNTRGREHLS